MMTQQSKKFIELFEIIIKENGFYKMLKKAYKKHKTLPSELFWVFEDRQPISVYGFLDSIEKELENRFSDCSKPRHEAIYNCIRNIINDLDRYGDWCD